MTQQPLFPALEKASLERFELSEKLERASDNNAHTTPEFTYESAQKAKEEIPKEVVKKKQQMLGCIETEVLPKVKAVFFGKNPWAKSSDLEKIFATCEFYRQRHSLYQFAIKL